VKQFFYLLFIGITNPIYNLVLGVKECFHYGRYRWWWKLRSRLFLLYLLDSPFNVIKREGPRAAVAIENLIYGETPCLTMKKILREIDLSPEDHFVDLGCGRGLTAFFVHFYYGIPVTGIEIIPTFILRAQKLTKHWGIKKIRFLRENLAWVTKEQLQPGTIFYLTSTTFGEELLDKIVLRLETLPIGVRLITLSEAIPSDQFRLLSNKTYYFSWGRTEVYFHEKIV
jgi:SAM-dependent methyltransferase